MTEKQFGHLADIGFERTLPSVGLRPYVQCYWSIRSNGCIVNQRDEFMHPDGGIGLVFNWGDELHLNESCYAQTVTLDEVWTRSQRMRLAGEVEAFGILFRPGGVAPLFAVPMNELSETAVLATHLAPSQLTHLHEILYKKPTIVEKANVIEQWLKHQLVQAQAPSPVVNASLAIIARTQGKLPMHDVADAVYMSTRQLERLFQAQVGLPPKKYARLVRVRQAREALKQKNGYVDVAMQHGFYDQAHFIREFKSVVGMTPGAYLLRRQTD